MDGNLRDWTFGVCINENRGKKEESVIKMEDNKSGVLRVSCAFYFTGK